MIFGLQPHGCAPACAAIVTGAGQTTSRSRIHVIRWR
jgi:hypothetical protein